ncbi:hypothetical protein C6P46_003192 [Rhodotorula mucilaginosa]|uniref:Uncharacterized protein n=1 Tax=Rhodotorula mucilaginosa TaxID=5537 RepID=A0A9P6W4U9_RHOMI|nr:hypothetical protein C6P46_003192 [Rhodotorula mucilaginosa]
MSQSDRHLFAHSDPDRAGRSVASTPTASRTATPTSVTPEQSDAFGMASRASGQESTFISTPRAWPRSRSTTVASGRSGAARESDPLAVLFASFPVPPVTEEDMLLRLERMLRPANGRHLFNLRPSNLRPPPDHPLPPLPPIPRDLEPSLDFEPAKLHTDALGLALTYAPPFRPTRDSGEATSSFTRQQWPAFIPRPRTAIPPPAGPPPSIPLPRIPTSSTSPYFGKSRKLATRTSLPATLSADRTDVEPRRGPPSNNWQDPIIDPLRAGPQDTSDSSVRNGKDGDANLARGADSYRSCRHADHEPVPLSPRSSSDLEVIKADLAELLASFRAVPICASSPRSRERSRTRSETEEVTSSIRPEHDSEESPPRYAEERKSSVMSVHSCTSTASSSSAHSDTTRGYKAYKLVRKEQSPARISPTTSRRSSLSTLSTTDSEPADADSDLEELFDLSFDSASQPQLTGSRTTAKGAARKPRTRTDSISEERAPGSHCNASGSNSHGHGSEDPAPTGSAAAPPLRRTLIKPLITASNAQSAYLPSSPKSASRIPPVSVDPSRLTRSLPLPRSPPGPRPFLTPDAAKASRLPRPQRAPPNRGDGTRITKPAALAYLHYYKTDGAITN